MQKTDNNRTESSGTSLNGIKQENFKNDAVVTAPRNRGVDKVRSSTNKYGFLYH